MIRPSEPALLGLTCAILFAAALGWVLHGRNGDLATSGSVIDEMPLPPVPSSEEAPPPDRRIHAVLQIETDVLATDGTHLYHAKKSDSQWRLVPTPESMSWLGHFAAHPIGSNKIFFYPERVDNVSVIDDLKTGMTRDLPPKEAREWNRQHPFGLYASDPEGREWERVNHEYDFSQVMVTIDGTVYAIASLHEDAERKDRVLRSKDAGRTWDDITHGATSGGFGRVHDLIPDPDHPNLVCLRCVGRRVTVVQAEDDRFDWKADTEWRWQERHSTAQGFFGTGYHFGGIENISDYFLEPTFGNYFRFPFGNRTSIDPFELVLEREEYGFEAKGKKEVTAILRFRRDDHAAAIMDLKGATDFWGLKIEDDAGRRTTIRPLAERLAYEGADDAYDRVRQNYERRAGLLKAELIAGKAYRRRVDLAQLCSFDQPGVYRVQLTYACPFWAGEGRVHWTGSFGSPLVKVTIK
jgi:hypothetical protein